MDESILANKLWGGILPDMGFAQEYRVVKPFILSYLRVKVMTQFYENPGKLYFGPTLILLCPF